MYIYKPDSVNVPIKVWSKEGSIEEGALRQIENAASLPFAFHHVSLMSDGHTGFGVPIGSVVAIQGAISPAIVGLDIGCGMCAVKTKIQVKDLDVKSIMGNIRKVVPVGFNHHEERQDESWMPPLKEQSDHMTIVKQQYQAAQKQVGTLGGGNHFLELQKDANGILWVMIHSGSRNFGLKIAEHYNRIAKKLNEQYFSSVPLTWDLAFLPIGSREAGQYIDEMKYAVEFAYSNRKLMMHNILGAIRDVVAPSNSRYSLKDGDMINIAHNYAKIEHHYGKDVWIHRKGATSAQEGEIGIIPGSQGTKSYIVKGKGNPESFRSCSHGAGRKMGRGQAIKTLDLQAEIKRLDDQGIIHAIRTERDLDEAPGSYKDIGMVMSEQSDLVEIITELSPIGVIKG